VLLDTFGNLPKMIATFDDDRQTVMARLAAIATAAAGLFRRVMSSNLPRAVHDSPDGTRAMRVSVAPTLSSHPPSAAGSP
jgi:hypothetical protein